MWGGFFVREVDVRHWSLDGCFPEPAIDDASLTVNSRQYDASSKREARSVLANPTRTQSISIGHGCARI